MPITTAPMTWLRFTPDLDAVTPADVQQVAADFFHPDHQNLLIYEP